MIEFEHVNSSYINSKQQKMITVQLNQNFFFMLTSLFLLRTQREQRVFLLWS